MGRTAGRVRASGDEHPGAPPSWRSSLAGSVLVALALSVALLGVGCTTDDGSDGSDSTDETTDTVEERPEDLEAYRAEVAEILGVHFAIVYAQGERGYEQDDDPEDFQGGLAYLAGQSYFLAERSKEVTPPEGYEDTQEALVDALEWDAEWRELEHEMALEAETGADLVEGSARVAEEMARDDYYLQTVFDDLELGEADVVDAYCLSEQAVVLDGIRDYLEEDPDAGGELAGEGWTELLWEFEQHSWLCPRGVVYEYDPETGALACPVHGDADRPDPLESDS